MKFQHELDGFAFRSFREIADRDYIAARICYHNVLPFQFNWAAQQALEKYFKAILLFNRIPSIKDHETKFGRDVGHNLMSSYNLILENPHIGLKLKKNQLKSLEFFNEHGINRYFNKNLNNYEIGVQELDELVSVIRPLCRAIWSYSLPENLAEEFASPGIVTYSTATSKYLRVGRRNVAYPLDGYLERVLGRLDVSEVHWEALTKNNLFFGEREDHDIENSKFLSWAIPTNELHPECIEELKKLVKLD